jgi:glycosyltransferase involved in cell wall biosynthesis
MLAIKSRVGSLLGRHQVAYVSSYPPRECGIATFTRDVAMAVDKFTPLTHGFVVAVNDGRTSHAYPALVRGQIERDVASSYDEAAALLNDSHCRAINIQHEYGLFGGDWGSHLLRLMDRVRQPIALTLHTVLPRPEPGLWSVTRTLIARAATTIVLSRSAVEILERDYGISSEVLRFIPHGVPNVRKISQRKAKQALGLAGRTVLATCGLMNPGKGIQYAIDAMAHLVDEFPDILYLVVGETHPGVRAASGEAYREQLRAQVERLGLGEHVRFDNRYLSYRELVLHLLAADVYIVPYLNLDQVVSGTLAYALGCGRAIVSTPSTYAKESLAEGRGVLAEARDAGSISTALGRILRDPAYKAGLQQRAYAVGHQMTWPHVAHAYLEAYRHICDSRRFPWPAVALPAMAEAAIPA